MLQIYYDTKLSLYLKSGTSVSPDPLVTSKVTEIKISYICTLFSGPNCGFTCRDSSNCYPISWVCDGLRDCDDGSDEANCAGRYHKYGQIHQFDCYNM